MGDCLEKTLTVNQFEPLIKKKLKLSRGRPKISAASIITYQTKKYFEHQSQLVQLKFMCIQRDCKPLLKAQIVDIMSQKFGVNMSNLFQKIQEQQISFLDRFEDPADDNFIDMCDFGQQLKHFNLLNLPHHVSLRTIFMVFTQYLSTDMDAVGFDQVTNIILDMMNYVFSNIPLSEQVPLFIFDKYDPQDQFKRRFIDTITSLMQDSLNSMQMNIISDICKIELS